MNIVTPGPSSDMYLMENMYYDTTFDSVHFDVAGLMSPRPNDADREDWSFPLRFLPDCDLNRSAGGDQMDILAQGLLNDDQAPVSLVPNHFSSSS